MPVVTLIKFIGSVTEAIQLCFDRKLIAPGLMILYASLDILAGLNRPEEKQESDSEDFKAWVNTYLLPDSCLNVTAEDLWAARCGLLHNYSPRSRPVIRGGAREIYYTWGPGRVEELEAAIEASRINAVVLHVDDILRAFQESFRRFVHLRQVSNDDVLFQRARLMLRNVGRIFPLDGDHSTGANWVPF